MALQEKKKKMNTINQEAWRVLSCKPDDKSAAAEEDLNAFPGERRVGTKNLAKCAGSQNSCSVFYRDEQRGRVRREDF